MSLTISEAKKFLQSMFPEGTGDYLDWDNAAADISKFFTAAGGVWKTYGTDIIDTLRAEISPSSVTQNIPIWEAALGLRDTPVAKFGTTAQRRNAIIGWLRQSGSFGLDDIRAIVQPYLLYANAANIQILETSRTGLDTATTYTGTAFGAIALNASTFKTVNILDDPRVDTGGVRINVTLSGTLDQIGVFLIGPDGTQAVWLSGYLGTGITGALDYTLHTPNFIGKPIKGDWTFGIWNGPAAAVINSWSLTISAAGVNYAHDVNGDLVYDGEGLGAGIFEMAVVADYSLLGTGYDITGAIRALERWKPAHVRATVVNKIDGSFCATPDTLTAIPGRAIPCS